MGDHQTVTVEVGNYRAEIDEEIARIVEYIWKSGITTESSCQEDEPGYAQITFPTAEDLEKLVFLLEEPTWQNEDDVSFQDFFERLFHKKDPSWQFSIVAFGGGYDGNKRIPQRCRCRCHFPRQDIPLVERLLQISLGTDH